MTGPAVNDDDREFEHSPLSGSFTRGDIEVDVEIYRFAGTQDRWQLAVVALGGGCTQWAQTFATETEAYAAFLAMVEADGLDTFTRARPAGRH
ncbi:hypothetical protein [Methylobacterium sp. E-066]|uniref:hypothetical protein n=1 Tax=Methylobacterium sp. E-066 TaxID=2836584 RepID=UPI001FB9D3FB|nr:hypothetical protein [Methylobacterium sp. E-066]MCJ2141515.1 hypothetical protein [Methylobacterium sp. E-066]